MDFDEVLDEIGEFGKYQLTNYLLLCLPVLFAAANSLSYVFTAGIPNYRCLVPECDNPTNLQYNEDWVQHAVPGKTDKKMLFKPELCSKYIYNNDTIHQEYFKSNDTCDSYYFSDDTTSCNEWVFEDGDQTIVQEWNITCVENQWKLSLVGTTHFAGIVVGSGGFGILADRYGRKSVFIFCIVFMSITGIVQGLANNYVLFLIFGFLNAVGTSGVYPLAFIIGVEMVGRRKREMSGIVLNYFYALGEAAVGLFMWLCKDWRTLQLIVSAPPILFIFYHWIVPESVRWLLAKEKITKANLIIRKAANINGVVLSDITLGILNGKTEETDDELNGAIKPVEKITKKKHEMLNTFKAMFSSRRMIVRMFILCYIWATNAFVYYGLSLNSTSLSGNKYLNFALVCLIEIPGYSLAWVAMNKIGRRMSLAGSLFLCGVTCIAGAFVTEELTWAVVTLFLIGKLGITSSFGIVFVHTAEMLPTIIRSGGVGCMSTIARVGALAAPFVPLLGNYMSSLPLLLFGTVSFIGGVLSLFLPETLGKKLPDTVEEAEH